MDIILINLYKSFSRNKKKKKKNLYLIYLIHK